MSWQLAFTISTIALIITALVKRSHSQKSLAPPSFPPALSYLLGIAPLGIIAGLILPHKVVWSSWLIFLLIIISFFMAISNWLIFRAIKQLPVMQYQLIARSQIVMIIAFGWILLGETLSHYQIIGAILLLIAALLAIKAPVKNLDSQHRKVHLKAVILTLVGCLAGTIGLISEKAALGHMDIGAYLIFGYSAQTIGLLILASKDVIKESLRQLTKHEIKWSAFMGIANGIGGVFYVFAIVKADNISLIAALSSITLPLIAFGAYIILKEKEQQKLLWTGLAIGFVGLLVMSLH